MNKEEIIEFTDINGKKIKGCGFGEPVKCQNITIKECEIKTFPVEATDLELDNEIADTIHYLARINVLGKEIERLNNIIKRLEEFIEKETEIYTLELTEKNTNALSYSLPIKAVYKEIYNVLQELKGDGSNDS